MERWTKDVLTKIVNYYTAGETFKVGNGNYTTSIPCVYVKYLRETKRSKLGFEIVASLEKFNSGEFTPHYLLNLEVSEALKKVSIMKDVEVTIYGGGSGRK